MPMKPTLFLIVAACTLWLSACGNKGPLVLPPPNPAPTHLPADHTVTSLPPVENLSEPVSTDVDNEDSNE